MINNDNLNETAENKVNQQTSTDNQKNDTDVENATQGDQQASMFLNTLKKGQEIKILDLTTKEAEPSPPTRYNSGSMILAMENAGKLIEDEELREQIKGAGIGTSATRRRDY